MQSKVIFFVLIMLSFSVIHDTVINVIDINEHTTIVHQTDENLHSQECESIDDIHAMFHLEALVAAYNSDFIQLPAKQMLSDNLHTYTFKYKETSYKPPKA